MKITFPIVIPKCHGLDTYEGPRPLWVVDEPFMFMADKRVYIIPRGFRFDWASVPRGLWNIFPPYDPRYAAAALIHDWLYGGELCPRKLADEVFLEAMKFRGVPAWKRSVMYAAVRMFGGLTYKNHTDKSVRRIRYLSGICGEKRPLWDSI